MAKTLTGVVVSTKNEKTIVVKVDRIYRHPLYRKVVKKSKKINAHYEGSDIAVGDTVSIKETRPISKNKHFIVLK